MSGTCFKCKANCIFKESKSDLFGYPCDFCRRVYCRNCANVSATEIRAIVLTARVLPFLCMKCLDCIKELRELSPKLSKLKEQVEAQQKIIIDTTDGIKEIPQLKKQMGELEVVIPTMNKELNKIKEDLKVLSEKSNEKSKQTYADVSKLQKQVDTMKTTQQYPNQMASVEPAISELQERERRAANVLLFGLSETDERDPSIKSVAEKQAVQKIFDKINEMIPVEAKIFRVGNYDQNKKRPVKIVLSSKQQAVQILKKRDMLNEANTGTYMKSDQTMAQRTFLKETIAELEKRKAEGEDTLKIKYIRGVPKIVKNIPANNQEHQKN